VTATELMAEACRLAEESVEQDWGGPFGAVIATMDGEVVATGQNRVLLTGDITAHAEIEAIRRAVTVLNPDAPSIPKQRRGRSTLELIPSPEVSADPSSMRARMLAGHQIYVSAAPCPMCMGAIYWARLEAVHFASDLEATREIGFDDAFLYEDLAKPHEERRIAIRQFRPELGAEALEAWASKPDRHPY
jgi:guanine deaminase